VKSPRRFLVVLLLAGWLGPLALTVRAADGCCCPEAMHGACMRMTASTCSLKRCVPDGGAALIAPKVVLATAPGLPAPAEIGILTPAQAARADDAFPDPFDPPPRA
jgi:hypothetical protein